MQCPKCGESVGGAAVICPRCDYILDTSFLGDDILNEKTGAHGPVTGPGDAVVLGGLDEEVALFSDNTGSFLTADTLDVDREVVPAALYVGKSVQELMKPEAVLKKADDLDKRKSMLSPFEMHVLSFIDGNRPVARLRKLTGLSSDDIRIAVGMLAEKGAVKLMGHIAAPDMKALLGDDISGDNTGPQQPAKTDSAPAPVEWKPVFPLDDVPVGMKSETRAAAAPSPWTEPKKDAPKPAPPMDAEARAVKERAAGFFELAHLELKKGNRVRAHVYAKLAADTDPHTPKYQELLKSWPAAARAAASTESALFADADIAEKQGNYHKALALLEQAVGVNPKASHIHNRLGLMYATRFKRFSDASESLMKAIELEPNNVAYKNNLGKIIALADEKGSRVAQRGLEKGQGGLLGKLKKAFD